MDTMFEKKFKINFPQRTLLHKMHIFLTCLFIFNVFFSILSHNTFTTITNSICVLCWGFNWYNSSKKHEKVIAEYKEMANKEKHELDMKNAFNFGYYQNK